MKVKGKLLQFNLIVHAYKITKNKLRKKKIHPHLDSNPNQLRNPYSTPIIIPQLPRLSPLDHTNVLSETAKIGRFKQTVTS